VQAGRLGHLPVAAHRAGPALQALLFRGAVLLFQPGLRDRQPGGGQHVDQALQLSRGSVPRRLYVHLYYPGYPAITWQAAPADSTPLGGVSPTLAAYIGLSSSDLAGALQRDQKTPISALSDGTSNTILSAEIAGKNDLYQNGRNTGQKLS